MKKIIYQYLAHFFTPPAIILNVYEEIAGNVNIALVVVISVITLVFWIISLSNSVLDRKRKRAEIAALEAEQRFYNMQCDCLKSEKNELQK